MLLIKRFYFILFICSIQPFYASVKVPVDNYNEWGIIHLAAEILRKNPVVVQAGGHDKDLLRHISFFWPNGFINIFEPNPLLFEELKNYITASHFRINLYSDALNSISGKALFYFDEKRISPKTGSLLKASDEWKWYYKDSSTLSVNCINLEDWASKNKISSIDFLWLNTGGTELNILMSIPHLLPSVQLIIVETHFQEFRVGTGLYLDLKEFLNSSGFEEIKHWNTPGFQGFAIFSKRGLVEKIQ